MGLLDRFRSLRKPADAKAKSLVLTNDAGWLDSAWPSNWFQHGYTSNGPSGNGPVVEACVAAYAQTVSQLNLNLWRKDEDGGRTRIASDGTSKYANIARLLHRPNDFQTKSDFVMNMIYNLLFNGNAYYYGSGVADRPDSLYLLDPRQTTAHKDPESAAIFYSTGGLYADMSNISQVSVVPSRYVCHLRLHTPSDPLIGVSPISSSVQSIAANQALTAHQAAFFTNMSRPSGFLSTDMTLSKVQMDQLREAWEAKAKGLNAGEMPILGSGLKYSPMAMSSQDAQLVEAWKMSVEDISRVFRVPLPLINSMDKATLNNSETLMNFWLSSGLGFMLRHIEENYEAFFGLGNEYEIEFDTDRLLRADLQGRMEALGTAVTKGIYSPDEARRKEGLAEVPGGHGKMPRVQQQMVPLDADLTPEPQLALPSPDEEPVDESEDETDDDIPENPEEQERMLTLLSRSFIEDTRNAA